MQAETPVKVQRWEREPTNIPIKLVLRAEAFKSDSMATTLDLSLHGMKVQTSLFLVPGEWVGIVPKGEFPQAIPARVVWAREDEAKNSTIAGLEFLQTVDA
jgi:hypothetical protein